MKILLKGMYFHPEVGGMETHMLNLARYFLKDDNKTEVVTSNSLGNSDFETYQDIDIYRTKFFGKSYLGWILTAMFSIPLFLKRASKTDIIHGHDIGAILPCTLAKILYKKPVVITLHSSHFLKVTKRVLFRLYFKWGLSRADFIFAASEEIRNVAKDIVPSKEITALVNPVDTELFSPKKKPEFTTDDDKYILVCPRRLVEKNGVHVLIEAMPKIISKHKVELYICGDGPLRDEIEERIEELGIGSQINLLGTVPNEKMPNILVSADLVIMPSLMEATSIAALESMATGKPIAASRVGGLPEIIDEETGYFMEPNNPKSISKTVNIALEDPNLLKQKGKKARQKVKNNWSAKNLAKRHLNLYRELASL